MKHLEEQLENRKSEIFKLTEIEREQSFKIKILLEHETKINEEIACLEDSLLKLKRELKEVSYVYHLVKVNCVINEIKN